MENSPAKATLEGWPTVIASTSLFLVAGAILTVRFPPSDLSGWLATAFGVTAGVPLLFAAALLLASALLIQSRSTLRPLRVVALVLAAISALMGFSTIFTVA